MAIIEATTIRDAVIKAIRKSTLFSDLRERNPNIKIYDNAVSQGLVVGSFFVKSMLPKKRHQYQEIYNRKERIAVRYFIPDDAEAEDAALMVSNSLLEILEYIEIDGELYRGYEMESNAADRVLHFYATYHFRVENVGIQHEAMDELKTEIMTRSDDSGGKK